MPVTGIWALISGPADSRHKKSKVNLRMAQKRVSENFVNMIQQLEFKIIALKNVYTIVCSIVLNDETNQKKENIFSNDFNIF